MKILYFGSDSFGIPCLDAIFKNHEIAGVVTSPDKPSGRGMKISSTPAKRWAERNKIETYQPLTLDGAFLEHIKKLEIDLIILISYGKKLPPDIIKIPKLAPVNVHPSLLPKYRGAAPIEWALIKGEKETGVTIITMSKDIDKGDILARETVIIEEKDDIFSLKEKLSLIASKMLPETIARIGSEGIRANPQRGTPSYARKLKKTDGLIDWSKTALEIHNLIRGLKEWPGTYTYLKNKYIKIFRSELISKQTGKKEKPGEILCAGDENLIEVACGKGALKITELQMEGKKKMKSSEFLKGFRIPAGAAFASKKQDCTDG